MRHQTVLVRTFVCEVVCAKMLSRKCTLASPSSEVEPVAVQATSGSSSLKRLLINEIVSINSANLIPCAEERSPGGESLAKVAFKVCGFDGAEWFHQKPALNTFNLNTLIF